MVTRRRAPKMTARAADLGRPAYGQLAQTVQPITHTRRVLPNAALAGKWVSNTGYTLQPTGQTVFAAALDRMRETYRRFDRVAVSFSGGKDSTSVLMIALTVARETGRLPLEVLAFDEEVIDPDTVAYIGEVAKWDDIRLHWFCVPVRHTLRSQTRTEWYPWDARAADLWARPMPPGAITADALGAPYQTTGENASIQTACVAFFKSHPSPVGVCLGIRAQESFNRKRNLLQTGSFISPMGGNVKKVKPIYDWNTTDVWRAIIDNNWHHSRFYDRMWLKGVAPFNQRVAPWGNVAGFTEAGYYAEFYPDFYERAIRRLPELRAQARYAKTKLYVTAHGRPPGMTWQEYTWRLIAAFDDEQTRKDWTNHVLLTVKRFATRNTIPFPEEEPAVDEGDGQIKFNQMHSWKRLATIVAKNDLMGRDRT